MTDHLPVGLALAINALLWGLSPYTSQAGATSYPYQLIELGTLGGRNCEALALNNNGQIVGWAEISNGQHHAALWDINDPLHPADLGTLGGNSSIAVAINNRGQSVGQARTGETGYHYHAVRFDWSLSQDNLDLGETTGYAYAINDAGQIVGNVQLNNGHWRAVLFDSTDPGQPIDLGTLPPTWGPDDSGATAINNEGRIIGWAYSGVGSSNFMRPVVFDPGGQGQNTRLTLGTDGGIAQGINDFGQIIGSSNEAGGACIFDTNTLTAQGLGTLPAGGSSEATAINNRGQIVGMVYRVFTPGLDPLPRAVLFDATGQGNNLDLNDAIDPNLEWRLNSAQGINDGGWIVGYGDTNENERRGFVLLPQSHPYQTLAHWTFDESQGHWLHDQMPGEHHGYAPVPPHWQPSAGRLDGACDFERDESFTVVDESFFDVTKQLTITGWIKFRQGHADHPTIISKGDSAWSLSLLPEATQIVFSLSTGQQIHRFTSTVSLEDDLYYHVCVTFDGRSMRLYLNGHEDPTGPLACTGPIDTNNDPVQIGGCHDDPNNAWRGALDDLRLYNYALTPHEIRKLFQEAPL